MEMKKAYLFKIVAILIISVLSFSCEKEETPELSGLTVKTLPLKRTYVEGQLLDLKGLLVHLSLSDGDFENIGYGWFEEKGITTSPGNNEQVSLGTESILITHTATGLSVEQPITVEQLKVVSMSVKSEPEAAEFELGGILDFSGLVVTLSMNDGTSTDVSLEDFENKGITTVPANGSEIGTDIIPSVKVIDQGSGIEVSFAIVINGLTVTDIDGNVYPVVKLGNQIWMTENLKVTHYIDGTEIPLVVDNDSWIALETGDEAYCWHNNEVNHAYGAHYTFAAVNTGKLCPEGWHIPSQEEWEELVDFLGGPDVAGGKLKGGGLDWAQTTGMENVGFNGMPAGWRGTNGNFGGEFKWGVWWSTTIIEVRGYAMRVKGFSAIADPAPSVMDQGYSVRCIKN